MVKVSRARAAALREEILDSTATELCRVGYDAIALTSVASRCNLATSAIYNRFPGKEELVSALISERLDPELGRALDADLSSVWQEEALISLVDGDQVSCLYELQLAARRTPELRAAVITFVEQRLEAALVARSHAERDGRVRSHQDPRAQVLLQAAGDTGTYLLALAGEAPNGGMASVDQVVRIALTNTPRSTPSMPGRPARRRRDPGRATPQPHSLDDLGAALVISAAEVFAEEGYDSATVAEIARRAGVTTGAIYNRFSGKGGLLAEVVTQVSTPRVMAELATLTDALTGGSDEASGKAISSIVERAREPRARPRQQPAPRGPPRRPPRAGGRPGRPSVAGPRPRNPRHRDPPSPGGRGAARRRRRRGARLVAARCPAGHRVVGGRAVDADRLGTDVHRPRRGPPHPPGLSRRVPARHLVRAAIAASPAANASTSLVVVANEVMIRTSWSAGTHSHTNDQSWSSATAAALRETDEQRIHLGRSHHLHSGQPGEALRQPDGHLVGVVGRPEPEVVGQQRLELGGDVAHLRRQLGGLLAHERERGWRARGAGTPPPRRTSPRPWWRRTSPRRPRPPR